MKAYVKPIQPTSTLSGEDARRIILEALTTPNKEAIEKNERRLAIVKSIIKE